MLCGESHQEVKATPSKRHVWICLEYNREDHLLMREAVVVASVPSICSPCTPCTLKSRALCSAPQLPCQGRRPPGIEGLTWALSRLMSASTTGALQDVTAPVNMPAPQVPDAMCKPLSLYHCLLEILPHRACAAHKRKAMYRGARVTRAMKPLTTRCDSSSTSSCRDP
jgi:hypothetical protein